jgi:hypothetical protein
MLRDTLWIMFLGLMIGGCATDSKMESSSDSSSSTAGAAVSSPTTTGSSSTPMTSDSRVADSSSTMSENAPSINKSNSSQNRIAAGVEEETLDSCIARIPKDATAGQRMLAEQTCRRDFSVRR